VLPDGSLFGEGVKTRLKEHLMEECNLHTIVRLPNSVFRPYASFGTNLLFFEKGEPTKDIWFYEHQVPTGQKAYSMTKPIRLEHLQGCIDWWGGKDRKGREETPNAWRVDIRSVINSAKSRALPHWDEAERCANQESLLKSQISQAVADARRLDEELLQECLPKERRAKLRGKIKELRLLIDKWRSDAAVFGEKSRREKQIGDGIFSAAYNLDIKNPHSVANTTKTRRIC
jgi:type I restriction-modification system DNA methylase subunit